ncbi:cytochrome c biogenesis protein ResB [Jatrophihabitans sp. DSM 45814]
MTIRPIRPLVVWRRLISMRTALMLLFFLALAAVPGSLLPQRPLNPARVQSYLQTHGSWGRFLDRIGAFDVFGSVWFSAIYLLLFASLIGCLIPRINVYTKALARQPLKAPLHLSRLPESGVLHTALSAGDAAAVITRQLRPRWRTVTRRPSPGAITVAAEKGYSREGGNLIFHVALLLALVLVACGRLLSFESSSVVIEGSGFCNPAMDSSFRGGRWVQPAGIKPFCIDDLDRFNAVYRDDGTPARFEADVTYHEGADGEAKRQVITVNHPLRLLGDRVYLINHGFAPTVRVTRPGHAPFTDVAVFLPQDGFLTSEGVFKFGGAAGAHRDIGLQAIFAPTARDDAGVITSVSPQPNRPVLAVIAFVGDDQVSDGRPESVYALDTSNMTRVRSQNLAVGQSMAIPDGTTVTFTGYKQWASLQVSHDPTQTALLITSVVMVAGLLCSLSVRRRRVWLRLLPAADPGMTMVELGGLARSDSGASGEEFLRLCAGLRSALADAEGGSAEKVSREGFEPPTSAV